MDVLPNFCASFIESFYPINVLKKMHSDRWILLDSLTNCENSSTMSLSHNVYYNLLRYCKHFYPGKITKLCNISLHRMDDMWCNDLVTLLVLYFITMFHQSFYHGLPHEASMGIMLVTC